MEICISRESLHSALTAVKRIVERRNSIPVLSNVLLTATDSGLSIRASDLDMESAVQIACEVSLGGAGTFPAHTLADMVKAAPAGAMLRLESLPDIRAERRTDTKDSAGKIIMEEYAIPSLSVRGGGSRATLNGIQAQDFPLMSEIKTEGLAMAWTHSFDIPAATLRGLFEQTAFAISTEETRYYLNGVHLVADLATLTAVATDGHKLARAETEAPQGSKGMPCGIVPRLAVAELLKLLAKRKDSAIVRMSVSFIRVEIGGFEFTSKLIDGTFPDFRRVIPASSDRRARVERAGLISALKQVGVIAGERGRACKLTFDDLGLKIEVSNPDSGKISAQIDADVEGAPIEIGFNLGYLLKIAETIPGDFIEFGMNDSGSPTILRARLGAPLLCVLMPLWV